MSIDSQRCQSIVVNNVHWYALFQGYCSGNVLFPFYCPGCKHIIPHLSHDANGPLPKYQNLLLPTMSIDRQRGLSIVVDNGHWQERLRGHCVAAMIYLLYVQGVADQVSPKQSTNHNTTDNATHLTPMMLIALLLRHTTLKHPLTLYSYHAPIAAHHDTSCTHFIPMWSK